MKRTKVKKRRDRKTGESPYAKYNKAPYQYSSEYYAWRSKVLGGRAQRRAS